MAEQAEKLTQVKSPFSAYDFFGYLVPGLAFLVSIYLFEIATAHWLKTNAPLHSILQRTAPPREASALAHAIFAISLTLCTYVIGHVIAGISSLVIDRILIKQGHGYPYERLLLKPRRPLRHICLQQVCRGAFFWGNLAVWFLFLMSVWGAGDLPKYLVATVMGMAFGLPIMLALVVTTYYRHAKVADDQPVQFWIERHLLERMVRAYSLGFNFVSWVLNYFFRWDDPIDPPVVEGYKTAFRHRFGVAAEEAGTQNYWFSHFYVTETSPTMAKSLVNWFQLCAFTRNASCAFYLAFLYCVAATAMHTGYFTSPARICLVGVTGIFFMLAIALGVRFYYLYASYYSKYLFRAFVYLNSQRGRSA